MGYAGSAAGLGGPPARKTGGLVILGLAALVLVNLYVFVWDKDKSVGAMRAKAESEGPALEIPARPLDGGEGGPGLRASGSGRPDATPQPAAGSGSGVATATVDGKIGKSDTLGRVLKKTGLAAAEVKGVIRALAGVLDFKAIRAGQTFHLERDAMGHVARFDLVVAKGKAVHARRDDKGELVGAAD